eukprot:gene36180-43882_t
MLLLVALLLVQCSLSVAWSHAFGARRLTGAVRSKVGVKLGAILRDEKGYEIKPADWFNGLSLDPGASLTDPRAVPADCRQFAEDIKGGKREVSIQDTLAIIDKHYEYIAVPFTVGDAQSKSNENIGDAKILSFALMTRMNEEQTLRLFGEVYRNLSPTGTDHTNLRNFAKLGWAKVVFKSGLAIVSKLQAYEDTDSALATQNTIEGAQTGWDVNSDSWIP